MDKWTTIVAKNQEDDVIFTTTQTDGTTRGGLSAIMAYYYIMYGILPQSMDFTCAAVHMKEIRLFILFETARLSSLPAMWTDSEKELYDGHEDARRANFVVRRQRNAEKARLEVIRSKARPDYNLLNAQLFVIDDLYEEEFNNKR